MEATTINEKMLANQMIDVVGSVLVPKQKSKVSFSVENTDEMNTGNYFCIGNREKKKLRKRFRMTKFTDF